MARLNMATYLRLAVYDRNMPVQLNVSVPDDLMEWLALAAERNFRTPEGQVLWLLKSARGERRGMDGEAREALFSELRKLHEVAGMPTYRVITERIEQQGGNASLTTVYSTIRGGQLSSWGIVENIVTALDGDVEHFRALWVQARSGRQPEQTEKA
jgi:hypothetical protein